MAELSIRVLLVDHSELVRTGLKALLGAERCIYLVGEATSMAAGVAAALQHRPDVVLMDIHLPDGTGFDAARAILARHPETRILILSSVADDDLVDEAVRCGAQGYLLKEVNGNALIKAISDVAGGKSILDPALTARSLERIRHGSLAQTKKT